MTKLLLQTINVGLSVPIFFIASTLNVKYDTRPRFYALIRNTSDYKSVFRLKIYYASKRGVLHDLEAGWTVQRPDLVAQNTLKNKNMNRLYTIEVTEM